MLLRCLLAEATWQIKKQNRMQQAFLVLNQFFRFSSNFYVFYISSPVSKRSFGFNFVYSPSYLGQETAK